jgi:hypothetical protein
VTVPTEVGLAGELVGLRSEGSEVPDRTPSPVSRLSTELGSSPQLDREFLEFVRRSPRQVGAMQTRCGRPLIRVSNNTAITRKVAL